MYKKLEKFHVYFVVIVIIYSYTKIIPFFSCVKAKFTIINIWFVGIKCWDTITNNLVIFFLFSCKTTTLWVLNCYIPCIPSPVVVTTIHHSTSCIYEFYYSKTLIGIKYYGLFINWLTSFGIMSSRFFD